MLQIYENKLFFFISKNFELDPCFRRAHLVKHPVAVARDGHGSNAGDIFKLVVKISFMVGGQKCLVIFFLFMKIWRIFCNFFKFVAQFEIFMGVPHCKPFKIFIMGVSSKFMMGVPPPSPLGPSLAVDISMFLLIVLYFDLSH